MSIEGWKLKRLDEIGTICSGATPSTTNPGYWDGEIVWVTPNDLSKLNTPYLADSNKKITQQGLQSCSSQIIPAGSIILSSRAPIGYVAITKVECCTNQGCKSFNLKPQYNSEFVYYNLNFNINKIKNLGEGTTFAEISKTTLSKVQIPFLESKHEQIQIATIFSTIDRAIEQTEAIIAKQQRIKIGLMQDLLTKGIDEHGNIRSEETHEFKDSPLGRIPVDWTIESLGEVVEKYGGKIQTGPFGSQLHAHEYTDEGIPVVMPQDITESNISLSNIARITNAKANDLSRHRMRAGDVVFARRGDLSRCASINQAQSGWVCGTGCLLLRLPTNVLSSRWVAEIYKNHNTQKQVLIQAVGSTMVNLNTKILSNLKIPLPKISEQTQIEEHFYQLQKSQENLIDIRHKLNSIKNGLMQELLTGKVRVTDVLN